MAVHTLTTHITLKSQKLTTRPSIVSRQFTMTVSRLKAAGQRNICAWACLEVRDKGEIIIARFASIAYSSSLPRTPQAGTGMRK